MNPALIIIDVQKGIDEVQHWGGNRNNPHAEENIILLLDAWRERGFPVFLVKHNSRSLTSPFYPGKIGNDLKDIIKPQRGDELIVKQNANAFLETELRGRLVGRKITEVVITGFVTNNSVESTARMSGESGFKTVVVEDATACFDKKGLDGTIYPSALIHQISLSNLNSEYADIKTTRAVLSEIHQLS